MIISVAQLGMKDIKEIERMTLYEYEIRKTAYRIAYLDKSRELHDQAWLNQQIKATKKAGKKEVPYYKNKKDFFDYERQFNEVLGMQQPSQIGGDKIFEELLRKASL